MGEGQPEPRAPPGKGSGDRPGWLLGPQDDPHSMWPGHCGHCDPGWACLLEILLPRSPEFWGCGPTLCAWPSRLLPGLCPVPTVVALDRRSTLPGLVLTGGFPVWGCRGWGGGVCGNRPGGHRAGEPGARRSPSDQRMASSSLLGTPLHRGPWAGKPGSMRRARSS